MANEENPRDRIPGTRSRFRFPYSDSIYAFIGPAIVVVLAVIIGLYVMGDWIGDNEGTMSPQPSAVVPDSPPRSPSNPAK